MRRTDRDIAKLTQQYSHAHRQEQLDFLASLDDLDALLETAPTNPSEQQAHSSSRQDSPSVNCTLPCFISESVGMEVVFQSTGTMLDQIFLEKHVLQMALESDALLLWCFKSNTKFPDHLMRQIFFIAVSDPDLLLAQTAGKSFTQFYKAGLSEWLPNFEDIVQILNSFQGVRLFDSETAERPSVPTTSFSWHSTMLFRHFCECLLVAFKHVQDTSLELTRELLRVFLLLCCDRFVNEVSNVYARILLS